MASLSETDRARVRHHLGYLGTAPSASIQLGVPAATQPGFLVERAMSNLLDATVPLVLKDLGELDCIERQQSESRKRLSAQRLGELQVRSSNNERTEAELLQIEYRRWQAKLANDLGVPVNPFMEGAGSINIPRALG